MVQVQRSFPVAVSMGRVVEYLKDFTHAEAWDPGTKSCARHDGGPIVVGSSWHNVSEFRGRETELEYELVRLTADHLTFVGKNKTATSTDDMAFAADGDRTSITYQATIEFHGLAKLAGPFLRREFEKLGDEVVTTMTRVLEGLPAGG